MAKEKDQAPPPPPTVDEKLKAFNDVHAVVAQLPRADQIEVLGAIARFLGIASSVEVSR